MVSRYEIKRIARERIQILLDLADKVLRKDEQLAKRYVQLAFRIAAKAHLKLPREVKRRYCRKCKIPLIPGYTARIRVKKGCGGAKIVVTCLRCGYIRRYPLRSK
ncbi:MAG: ribonuclease P protein component 4 [Thermofilaceae archaeon]